jgi:hypothetical protein
MVIIIKKEGVFYIFIFSLILILLTNSLVTADVNEDCVIHIFNPNGGVVCTNYCANCNSLNCAYQGCSIIGQYTIGYGCNADGTAFESTSANAYYCNCITGTSICGTNPDESIYICNNMGSWVQNINCDSTDGWVCSGTQRQYMDYSCDAAVCFSEVTSTENCATKLSTDIDGNNPAIAGSCNDYSTCLSGACPITGNPSDTCTSTTQLTEYYASGVSCLSTIYNCGNIEVPATDSDGGNNPAANGNCIAGMGATCNAGAYPQIPGSSGADDCGGAGACGTGPNSCLYREYYVMDSEDACAGADTCNSTTYDADTNSNTCTTCSQAWAIGGETAAINCCGDDSSEYAKTCIDSSENGNCGMDTTACCTLNNTCVNVSGNCQNDGLCHPFSAGKNSYCNKGSWEDPDEAQAYCIAAGCNYTWVPSGPIISQCCGDDGVDDDWCAAGYSSCLDGMYYHDGDNNQQTCECGGGAWVTEAVLMPGASRCCGNDGGAENDADCYTNSTNLKANDNTGNFDVAVVYKSIDNSVIINLLSLKLMTTDKNGMDYKIGLVDPLNSHASNIMVQTATGAKTIRKIG